MESIDEDRVTASIESTISQDLTMPPKPSIFRTPNILSEHNPKAYIPNAFSVGPFHHDNPNIPNFQRTEKIKARYLKSLISRSSSPATMLRELVRSIASLETEARKCYAGLIDCPPRIDHHPVRPVDPLRIEEIEHILDLFRKWLISSIGGDQNNNLAWQRMPSVTRLVDAGIKFKRGKSSNILSINFDDRYGVLEIPPLLIQETTEIVFRNLIAFEQCYPNCESRFTSYAVLLDNLINTSKDINILCENEILDSWLNPEDAVQFFCKLYHNTFVKEYYYLNICEKVNKYCKRPWPRWRAALVSKYFFTPWAAISTVAAAALLLFTLLQTVFAIIKK